MTYTDADGIVHAVVIEEIRGRTYQQTYYKKMCVPLMVPVPLTRRERENLIKPGVVTCLKCLAQCSS